MQGIDSVSDSRIEHDYSSADLVPPSPLTIGASLYSFLCETCGIDVVLGVAGLEPGRVGNRVRPVFRVEPVELCMIIRQIDYTEAKSPSCTRSSTTPVRVRLPAGPTRPGERGRG